MKRKYLLIIPILVLLLTGCKANYEIEIKNDYIKEELYVYENDSKKIYDKDDLDMSFDDYAKHYGKPNKFHFYINTDNMYLDDEEECVTDELNDCSEYDREYVSNDKETGFALSTKFSFEEYKKSGIANDMLPGFNATFDGRYLKISGGDNYNFINGYKNLDEITITIKSTYKVIETNINKKDSGIYEIKISKDNNPKEKLYITFDTKDESVDIANNTSKTFIYIILIALAVVVLMFLINFYIKYRDNNR